MTLDGYPDLYEIPSEMIPHMEALGIVPRHVPNERIAAQVLKNLDRQAAQDAFEEWIDLDVVHIDFHREATGAGPVGAILAAAGKGAMTKPTEVGVTTEVSVSVPVTTEVSAKVDVKGDGRMETHWKGKYDARVDWKHPLHLPWPHLWRVAGFIFAVTFALTIVLLWLADVFPI